MDGKKKGAADAVALGGVGAAPAAAKESVTPPELRAALDLLVGWWAQQSQDCHSCQFCQAASSPAEGIDYFRLGS